MHYINSLFILFTFTSSSDISLTGAFHSEDLIDSASEEIVKYFFIYYNVQNSFSFNAHTLYI